MTSKLAPPGGLINASLMKTTAGAGTEKITAKRRNETMTVDLKEALFTKRWQGHRCATPTDVTDKKKSKNTCTTLIITIILLFLF
jgi:hypothetical protein